MNEPTYQDWKDAMARFIRYRINAMGLTVEDLARKSGLPLEYVLRVVEAEKYPPHKARTMMEKALGCSLEHVEPKMAKDEP